MKKFKFHHFKTNELDAPRQRAFFRHHMRRFLTVYRYYGVDMHRQIFEGHIETVVKRKPQEVVSLRFHIGNAGSSTPWDGHILLFGIGFFWGHSAFRKLAARLTRCSGYPYDTRDWSFRISDGRLWWEFANHDDSCEKVYPHRGRKKKNGRYKQRTWRRGSIAISPAEWFWGPKRYSYETVDGFATVVKFPDGDYPVLVNLQKQYYGRTKTDQRKHIPGWNLDVDAPSGIPTHVDHSGGWKGDRTYGFGVDFSMPREDWKIDAEAAVMARILDFRARSGFRTPDSQED